MDAISNKIKPNGEITIPASFLKKLGLKPGADIFIHLENNAMVIEKPHRSLKHLRGRFKNLDIETPTYILKKKWDKWSRKISV